MKTITYRRSTIINNSEHTYFVNISDKHPTWYYTYKMTEEGFYHFIDICKLAGYTIIDKTS